MQKRYSFGILLVIAILLSLIGVKIAQAGHTGDTVSSTIAYNEVVNDPWTSKYLADAEDGVRNVSTAFVGNYQIPMISYSRNGQDNIFQAHTATSAVAGNCGPDNTWYCNNWYDPDLIPGTVSQMATIQYIQTHAIRWAFSTGSMIRGATIELMNDMTFVTDNWLDLIQINKFGSSIIGVPSLQIDSGGHYMIAVTILGSGDLYPHSLVYMYYVGGSNTSCKNTGSPYQCDVIDQSYGNGSMGASSLQIAQDGSVGIAYYKSGEVMYAYPHVTFPGWPSNCGPSGDTWRCISIFAGTVTGAVGSVVDFAWGETTYDRGIAFTYDDTLIPVTLYHADYVGNGGNCGSDLRLGGELDYRWQCDDIINFDYLNPALLPSFSIEIDPLGFSAIAFDYANSDLSNKDLYITYPKARVGNADPGWIVQHIDGAPVFDVDTGAQVSFSLDDTGRGFISYLQLEDYELPDIKFAYQVDQTFLPLLTRP
jgi:hypothetical protein